jgi:ABC-type polysaccharide/polyol phosphate transport system ATPase subunit
MGRSVIELDGVGKRYRLGEHHGDGTDLRETVSRVVRRLRKREPPVVQELWSLRDVSLTVFEGEAVGIVGANGAGKSTLLKVVSNITTPTEGRCRTRGRVGSLLEVGTGFHGDLTGLENTYLNGAILGMSRRDVTNRLDDIITFAGLERFMDTPVKRYSSGMYLRLGFAIAAHMDADILVVDEVLAVGDAEFQRRCLRKMSEVEKSGRTVIFVSHNMDAVARLCPTAVWLDRGSVRMAGPSDAVIAEYARSTLGTAAVQSFEFRPELAAQISAVRVTDGDHMSRDVVTTHEHAWIEIDLDVRETVASLDVGVLVSSAHGVNLLDEAHSDADNPPIGQPGTYRLRCPLPAVLAPGDYVVGVWLGTAYETIEMHSNAVQLSIDGDDAGRPERLFKLGLPWEVNATS